MRIGPQNQPYLQMRDRIGKSKRDTFLTSYFCTINEIQLNGNIYRKRF